MGKSQDGAPGKGRFEQNEGGAQVRRRRARASGPTRRDFSHDIFQSRHRAVPRERVGRETHPAGRAGRRVGGAGRGGHEATPITRELGRAAVVTAVHLCRVLRLTT